MGKLEQLVRASSSFRQVAKRLGIGHQAAKKMIQKEGIDTTHFDFGRRYLASVGEQHGRLTIREVFKAPTGKWMAKCDCKCGTTGVDKRLDFVRADRVTSCGCAIRDGRPSITGSSNPAFSGHGELRAVHIATIRKCAARRGIHYELTPEYLWELFLRQEARCALSGSPLNFGRIYFPLETTASLDRIDSTQGYTVGNVQWVHKDVNMLKKGFNEGYFIELCARVTAHTQGRS